MFYTVIRFLLHIWYRLFFRFEVDGAHHIPHQGPVLICSNHISNWDPPLIGLSVPRKAFFMAKKELFNYRLSALIFNNICAIPIKRGVPDKSALRKMVQLLNEGQAMIMFPEGTRSKTGELGKAHTGAGYLAVKTNAVIIPAAIFGSYRIFGKVRVVMGAPLYTDDLSELSSKEAMNMATERMMQGIKNIQKKKESVT